MTKVCTRCKIEKEIGEFYHQRGGGQGRRGSCIKCDNARVMAYKNSEIGKAAEARLRRTTRRYIRAKGNATYRGLEFAISKEEYYELTSKPCKYCGDIRLAETGGGLDRIDNSIGYIITNVFPCCTVCNKARSDYFTPQEMLRIGEVIRQIKLERNNHEVSNVAC